MAISLQTIFIAIPRRNIEPLLRSVDFKPFEHTTCGLDRTTTLRQDTAFAFHFAMVARGGTTGLTAARARNKAAAAGYRAIFRQSSANGRSVDQSCSR